MVALPFPHTHMHVNHNFPQLHLFLTLILSTWMSTKILFCWPMLAAINVLLNFARLDLQEK